MKYRHFPDLRKMVFDEFRHFRSRNHKYRTTKKHLSNDKEETGLKPRRMTPQLWMLEYNRINNSQAVGT